MTRNPNQMVKLHITFDEPQDGIWGEYLWATPMRNGYYRLENHPLAAGLCFGDIVKATFLDDMLEFEYLALRDLSVAQPGLNDDGAI